MKLAELNAVRILGPESKERFVLDETSVEKFHLDCKSGKKSRNYDFIISNPPYIPSKNIGTLDLQIRKYESCLALDGGEDGLKIIKEILDLGSLCLRANGYIFLEIDSSHGEDIKTLMKNYSNLNLEGVINDYYGSIRYAIIRKKL